MSPEAIELPDGMRRLKVGRPSDVWSLGCILYQMVYGHPPFQHLSVYQKMKAIPDISHVRRPIDKVEETTATIQQFVVRPLKPIGGVVAFLKGLQRGMAVYFKFDRSAPPRRRVPGEDDEHAGDAPRVRFLVEEGGCGQALLIHEAGRANVDGGW